MSNKIFQTHPFPSATGIPHQYRLNPNNLDRIKYLSPEEKLPIGTFLYDDMVSEFAICSGHKLIRVASPSGVDSYTPMSWYEERYELFYQTTQKYIYVSHLGNLKIIEEK